MQAGSETYRGENSSKLQENTMKLQLKRHTLETISYEF